MIEVSSLFCNKVGISIEKDKFWKFSSNEVRFYLHYSSFVCRALENLAFQRFVCEILKKEDIESQAVRAVHVRVLPSRKKNGHGIAGKCDPSQGKIHIYPKTIRFCQMFKQKFGRKALLTYAGNRARAALIHELLHLKYTKNEKTVRTLAKHYFFAFTQRRAYESSFVNCIHLMIFR